MTGILAIWNDCQPDRFDAYEAWYQQDHMASRVRLAGFRVGRRYEAIAAKRQFMTTYEVEHPDIVLRGKDYLDMFNNPDPATTAMMRHGFYNAIRTVCHRSMVQGEARWAILLTASFLAGSDDGVEKLERMAATIALSPALAHLELWQSAETTHLLPSQEEILRGGDEKIVGSLVLEFLREAPALACADFLQKRLPSADIGIYRLMAELRRDDCMAPALRDQLQCALPQQVCERGG